MDKPGYITLISVLILGAIFTSTLVFFIDSNLSHSLNSWYLYKDIEARRAANSCVEMALQRVNDSVSYSGNDSLIFANSSCSYEVLQLAGQNREIYAIGSSQDSVSKIKVVIDSIRPEINISSWQQGVDF